MANVALLVAVVALCWVAPAVKAQDPGSNNATQWNALIDFYRSAGGPAWSQQDGWGSTASFCTWSGILCDGNTPPNVMGIVLHDANVVVAAGSTFSVTLTNIATLVVFDLRDNAEIAGNPLPSSWLAAGAFPMLQVFRLAGCGLSNAGALNPLYATAWPTLQVFDVGNNPSVTGPFPPAWTLPGAFPQLTELHMANLTALTSAAIDLTSLTNTAASAGRGQQLAIADFSGTPGIFGFAYISSAGLAFSCAPSITNVYTLTAYPSAPIAAGVYGYQHNLGAPSIVITSASVSMGQCSAPFPPGQTTLYFDEEMGVVAGFTQILAAIEPCARSGGWSAATFEFLFCNSGELAVLDESGGMSIFVPLTPFAVPQQLVLPLLGGAPVCLGAPHDSADASTVYVQGSLLPGAAGLALSVQASGSGSWQTATSSTELYVNASGFVAGSRVVLSALAAVLEPLGIDPRASNAGITLTAVATSTPPQLTMEITGGVGDGLLLTYAQCSAALVAIVSGTIPAAPPLSSCLGNTESVTLATFVVGEGGSWSATVAVDGGAAIPVAPLPNVILQVWPLFRNAAAATPAVAAVLNISTLSVLRSTAACWPIGTVQTSMCNWAAPIFYTLWVDVRNGFAKPTMTATVVEPAPGDAGQSAIQIVLGVGELPHGPIRYVRGDAAVPSVDGAVLGQPALLDAVSNLLPAPAGRIFYSDAQQSLVFTSPDGHSVVLEVSQGACDQQLRAVVDGPASGATLSDQACFLSAEYAQYVATFTGSGADVSLSYTVEGSSTVIGPIPVGPVTGLAVINATTLFYSVIGGVDATHPSATVSAMEANDCHLSFFNISSSALCNEGGTAFFTFAPAMAALNYYPNGTSPTTTLPTTLATQAGHPLLFTNVAPRVPNPAANAYVIVDQGPFFTKFAVGLVPNPTSGPLSALTHVASVVVPGFASGDYRVVELVVQRNVDGARVLPSPISAGNCDPCLGATIAPRHAQGSGGGSADPSCNFCVLVAPETTLVNISVSNVTGRSGVSALIATRSPRNAVVASVEPLANAPQWWLYARPALTTTALCGGDQLDPTNARLCAAATSGGNVGSVSYVGCDSAAFEVAAGSTFCAKVGNASFISMTVVSGDLIATVASTANPSQPPTVLRLGAALQAVGATPTTGSGAQALLVLDQDDFFSAVSAVLPPECATAGAGSQQRGAVVEYFGEIATAIAVTCISTLVRFEQRLCDPCLRRALPSREAPTADPPGSYPISCTTCAIVLPATIELVMAVSKTSALQPSSVNVTVAGSAPDASPIVPPTSPPTALWVYDATLLLPLVVCSLAGPSSDVCAAVTGGAIPVAKCGSGAPTDLPGLILCAAGGDATLSLFTLLTERVVPAGSTAPLSKTAALVSSTPPTSAAAHLPSGAAGLQAVAVPTPSGGGGTISLLAFQDVFFAAFGPLLPGASNSSVATVTPSASSPSAVNVFASLTDAFNGGTPLFTLTADACGTSSNDASLYEVLLDGAAAGGTDVVECRADVVTGTFARFRIGTQVPATQLQYPVAYAALLQVEATITLPNNQSLVALGTGTSDSAPFPLHFAIQNVSQALQTLSCGTARPPSQRQSQEQHRLPAPSCALLSNTVEVSCDAHPIAIDRTFVGCAMEPSATIDHADDTTFRSFRASSGSVRAAKIDTSPSGVPRHDPLTANSPVTLMAFPAAVYVVPACGAPQPSPTSVFVIVNQSAFGAAFGALITATHPGQQLVAALQRSPSDATRWSTLLLLSPCAAGTNGEASFLVASSLSSDACDACVVELGEGTAASGACPVCALLPQSDLFVTVQLARSQHSASSTPPLLMELLVSNASAAAPASLPQGAGFSIVFNRTVLAMAALCTPWFENAPIAFEICQQLVAAASSQPAAAPLTVDTCSTLQRVGSMDGARLVAAVPTGNTTTMTLGLTFGPTAQSLLTVVVVGTSDSDESTTTTSASATIPDGSGSVYYVLGNTGETILANTASFFNALALALGGGGGDCANPLSPNATSLLAVGDKATHSGWKLDVSVCGTQLNFRSDNANTCLREVLPYVVAAVSPAAPPSESACEACFVDLVNAVFITTAAQLLPSAGSEHTATYNATIEPGTAAFIPATALRAADVIYNEQLLLAALACNGGTSADCALAGNAGRLVEQDLSACTIAAVPTLALCAFDTTNDKLLSFTSATSLGPATMTAASLDGTASTFAVIEGSSPLRFIHSASSPVNGYIANQSRFFDAFGSMLNATRSNAVVRFDAYQQQLIVLRGLPQQDAPLVFSGDACNVPLATTLASIEGAPTTFTECFIDSRTSSAYKLNVTVLDSEPFALAIGVTIDEIHVAINTNAAGGAATDLIFNASLLLRHVLKHQLQNTSAHYNVPSADALVPQAACAGVATLQGAFCAVDIAPEGSAMFLAATASDAGVIAMPMFATFVQRFPLRFLVSAGGVVESGAAFVHHLVAASLPLSPAFASPGASATVGDGNSSVQLRSADGSSVVTFEASRCDPCLSSFWGLGSSPRQQQCGACFFDLSTAAFLSVNASRSSSSKSPTLTFELLANTQLAMIAIVPDASGELWRVFSHAALYELFALARNGTPSTRAALNVTSSAVRLSLSTTPPSEVPCSAPLVAVRGALCVASPQTSMFASFFFTHFGVFASRTTGSSAAHINMTAAQSTGAWLTYDSGGGASGKTMLNTSRFSLDGFSSVAFSPAASAQISIVGLTASRGAVDGGRWADSMVVSYTASDAPPNAPASQLVLASSACDPCMQQLVRGNGSSCHVCFEDAAGASYVEVYVTYRPDESPQAVATGGLLFDMLINGADVGNLGLVGGEAAIFNETSLVNYLLSRAPPVATRVLSGPLHPISCALTPRPINRSMCATDAAGAFFTLFVHSSPAPQSSWVSMTRAEKSGGAVRSAVRYSAIRSRGNSSLEDASLFFSNFADVLPPAYDEARVSRSALDDSLTLTLLDSTGAAAPLVFTTATCDAELLQFFVNVTRFEAATVSSSRDSATSWQTNVCLYDDGFSHFNFGISAARPDEADATLTLTAVANVDLQLIESGPSPPQPLLTANASAMSGRDVNATWIILNRKALVAAVIAQFVPATLWANVVSGALHTLGSCRTKSVTTRLVGCAATDVSQNQPAFWTFTMNATSATPLVVTRAYIDVLAAAGSPPQFATAASLDPHSTYYFAIGDGTLVVMNSSGLLSAVGSALPPQPLPPSPTTQEQPWDRVLLVPSNGDSETFQGFALGNSLAQTLRVVYDKCDACAIPPGTGTPCNTTCYLDKHNAALYTLTIDATAAYLEGPGGLEVEIPYPHVLYSSLILTVYAEAQPAISSRNLAAPTACSDIVATPLSEGAFCYSYEDYSWVLEIASGGAMLLRFLKASGSGLTFAQYNATLALIDVGENGLELEDFQTFVAETASVFPTKTASGTIGQVVSAVFSSSGSANLLTFTGNEGGFVTFSNFSSRDSPCNKLQMCTQLEAPPPEPSDPPRIAPHFLAAVVGATPVHTLQWEAGVAGTRWTHSFARIGKLFDLSRMVTASTTAAHSSGVSATEAPSSDNAAQRCFPPCVLLGSGPKTCGNLSASVIGQYVCTWGVYGNRDPLTHAAGSESCEESPAFQSVSKFMQSPQVTGFCVEDPASGNLTAVIASPDGFQLLAVASGAMDSYLQLRLSCSPCIPFFVPHTNPQPFVFILIGAVKTLLVTLGAFLFARHCTAIVDRCIVAGIASLTASLANFTTEREEREWKARVHRNYKPTKMSFEDMRMRLEQLLGFARPPSASDPVRLGSGSADGGGGTRSTINGGTAAIGGDVSDGGAVAPSSHAPLLRSHAAARPISPEFLSFFEECLSNERRALPLLTVHPDVIDILAEIEAHFHAQIVVTTSTSSAAHAPGAAKVATENRRHLEAPVSTAAQERALLRAKRWRRKRRDLRQLRDEREGESGSGSAVGGLKIRMLSIIGTPRSRQGAAATGDEAPASLLARSEALNFGYGSAAATNGIAHLSSKHSVQGDDESGSGSEREGEGGSSSAVDALEGKRPLLQHAHRSGRLARRSVHASDTDVLPAGTATGTASDSGGGAVLLSRVNDAGEHVDTRLDRLVASYYDAFHRHHEGFEAVLLTTRLLDDTLTPMRWMLLIDAGYCLALLIASIIEGAQAGDEHGLTPWVRYQVVYFRLMNSTAVASFIVSSLVRCLLQRLPLHTDKFFLFGLVLVVPPLVTHCLVGAAVFAPVVLPPLLLGVFFERWTRRRFSTAGGSSMHLSFIARATARVLINFAFAVALSMSYNYAALYVYNRDGGGSVGGASGGAPSYAEAIVREFQSRNVVCTVNSFGTSIGNILQSMSSVGPSLF